MDNPLHLIEILLPLSDNEGRRFSEAKFARIREELTERFGGVTAFTRSPAHGTSLAGGQVVHDEIVVFEVMTDSLERDWWAEYRNALTQEFAQDEIVIRASTVIRL
jgi:hypothetical protein